MQSLLGVIMDFNLSPQGDGNPVTSGSMHFRRVISTYPRKGTETNMILYLLVHLRIISTYPRKGTETCNSVFSSIIKNFNLSPQGDGNITYSSYASFSSISTYPRKGTKNSASKKMRSFSFANLNSLFSVGFFSMNRAAAAFSLPWLLYCDKMCYNRANSKHLLQNTQTHFLFIVQFFHNL